MLNDHRHSGFTLVELLAVVAIISVLAAMLLPALQDSLQTACRTRCLSNQRQLYLAAGAYAGDFNDFLPPEGSKNGGDGVSFSNIGGGGALSDNSGMRSYVQRYVGIGLYSAEIRSGGTPLPGTVLGNTGCFGASGTIRGILSCPGAQATSADWAPTVYNLDYWFTGFGGCYVNGSHRWSKMGVVGAPSRGYPKALIADNLFSVPIPDHRLFMYTKAMGHSPNNPRGMNVMAGDGSGKWVEFFFDADPTGSRSHRSCPAGYYTQMSWIDWMPGFPAQQIWYMNPIGVTKNIQSHTFPTEYNEGMKLWY